MKQTRLFWRDKFNTAQRPILPSRAERWRELVRIWGEIAQTMDKVTGAHILEDPRAEIIDLKLGALEAHVVLAHGKVNDIAVALDGLNVEDVGRTRWFRGRPSQNDVLSEGEDDGKRR